MRRLVAIAGVLVLLTGWALTAANVVPATALDDLRRAISANELKPAECAGVLLAGVGPGGGGRLILGTPRNDKLNGGGGDDCILGGAGNDELKGNPGFDVCIGGPGLDTFHASCEIRIQ